jgi:hypothetical protein
MQTDPLPRRDGAPYDYIQMAPRKAAWYTQELMPQQSRSDEQPCPLIRQQTGTNPPLFAQSA